MNLWSSPPLSIMSSVCVLDYILTCDQTSIQIWIKEKWLSYYDTILEDNIYVTSLKLPLLSSFSPCAVDALSLLSGLKIWVKKVNFKGLNLGERLI